MQGKRAKAWRRLVPALLIAALLAAWALPIFAAPPAQSGVAQTPAGTPTAPVLPPDAVAGRATYSQACAPCHGATGQGDGPSASGLGFRPSAFADPSVISGTSPAELFQVAKNGRMERMMPPWGSQLSDQQIWDALGYAWSLHTNAAEIDKGKAVYQANCASCHGADGKGKAGMLDLSDFAATSTISQTTWANVVANGRGDMPGYGQKLDAASQKAVVEYARSLSFRRLFRGPLAAGNGVITGTVTNGTTGKPMPDQGVALHIFDNTDTLETRQAKTDAQGLYRFEGLPTDATLSFVVTTQYPANFPYGTDTTSFTQGQSTLNLPLNVYETTTDGSGIRADRVHFIVEFDGSQTQVAELLVFSLSGNRTYAGDGKAVLTIPLPQGAQNLAFQDGQLGQRYQAAADGFVDTLPLPPGNGARQLLYRYTLPYAPGGMDIVRSLPYPATAVNALISDRGEKVTSPQLTSQGVQQTQMGNYISLSATNVPANQPITLHFTNLPDPATLAQANSSDTAGSVAAATPATGSQALTIVLIAAVGFLAVALASWPLLRRRAARGAAPGRPEREGQDALVDALARLDLAHEAGELSDGDYRDQRLRLKARLADLRRAAGEERAHGG